jgi:TQXA domain-containing protein/LPXTG-motif cell wall-anchored protein
VFGPRNGKRSWAVRAVAIAGAAGALVIGAASTASAQDTTPATTSAKLTYDHSWLISLNDKAEPKDPRTPVVEFSLEINGKATVAYCTDLHHPSDDGGQYNEGDWKDSKAQDLPREQWILTNSFPNVAPSDVLSNAKVDASKLVGDELTKVVYTATQASLWHYSDGFELSSVKTTDKDAPSDTEFAAIQALYSWLVNNATEQQAPPPTLSFTSPATTAGPVGSKIGPFTVNTTAKTLTLAADNGGKVVDANGNAITSAANGDKFYVQPEKAGTTTVTASGTGTVPTGRLFTADKGANKFQKIILGGSGQVPVKATVSVTTNTASPSASASGTGAGSTLPVTGTSLTWIVVAAVVLLGGGAGLFVMARRRRTQ